MNRNLNTLSMTEAAMISGILVIFAMIATFLFSPVMLFYPVPAIILAKRRSAKYAVLSLTVAAMIITILLGIQMGLMFAVMYSPLAATMSYTIAKDEGANKTIICGATAFMLSFVVMMMIMSWVMGVNILQQMVDIVDEVFNIYTDTINNLSVGVQSGAENSAEFISYLEQMRQSSILAIKNLFPAMLISTSVLVAWVNYVVVHKFGGRFKADVIAMQKFSRFSFPKSFIVAMAGMLLLASAMVVFKFNVEIVQMNLLLVCYMAMFIQGISVLKFMLNKWNIGKIASVIIICMVLFLGPMAQIMGALGMCDLIFNIRKLNSEGV